MSADLDLGGFPWYIRHSVHTVSKPQRKAAETGSKVNVNPLFFHLQL